MDHDVKISVAQGGHFTYSPSHVRAKKGDTITFSTTDATQPFEVAFTDKSPGDKVFLSPGNNRLTINASPGIYHYAAAIYDPGQKRVFLDSGCGDVGVED